MVQRRAVRFVVFIFLDIHQSQECWMANAQTYVTIAMMYKILNNHVFVEPPFIKLTTLSRKKWVMICVYHRLSTTINAYHDSFFSLNDYFVEWFAGCSFFLSIFPLIEVVHIHYNAIQLTRKFEGIYFCMWAVNIKKRRLNIVKTPTSQAFEQQNKLTVCERLIGFYHLSLRYRVFKTCTILGSHACVFIETGQSVHQRKIAPRLWVNIRPYRINWHIWPNWLTDFPWPYKSVEEFWVNLCVTTVQ